MCCFGHLCFGGDFARDLLLSRYKLRLFGLALTAWWVNRPRRVVNHGLGKQCTIHLMKSTKRL